ncbi:carbonic anhydrase [Desertifilum sp. FACHB-1129]|uniref:Carbonic anhydrase n=1 Tax=Desertifilum tharense IPPAS B-1220 TaxID=1781255 RepID=A0A1E5QH78_9CYAN|nr:MULTISPECIES: carbonic anhydrase [Desertifilum]MDA0211933.1 carbonic anhydrase [Cyanobacteria bacterium FC1]MBD2314781.1 carbonic anhydrase [Desertifilum sp. FACHB-1129]MBD2325092.1 carbonic anhydrase [Desertifilum sp. FACHB-866]MBD2335213.1 carbonic anhydrase [Desertifilum sp. FACHB-868]OEJ73947.1 carbonic anhydrase [Desertifilum tharense IPPAS B-1220]
MRKLIAGLRQFRSSYYSTHRDLFEQLAHGQKPRVLFITCSDSRIDPNLMTQTDIGELFIIRNAGNIIPPFGAANGGEGAAVEYAIHALGIEQIVVCGHSHCGAMKGLLQLGQLEEQMPLVYDWLRHAEATRRLVKENYAHYEGEALLEVTVAENVLTQIENLKTYPVIHSKLYQNKLHIYGWIYMIETGEILAYDPETHSYVHPQSQLLDTAQQDLISDAAHGNVPPVACELPAGYLEDDAETSSPVQSEVLNPVQRLSTEQMERIYRGSHAKKR